MSKIITVNGGDMSEIIIVIKDVFETITINIDMLEISLSTMKISYNLF